MGDPVADTLRASLDGHLLLSRELAAAGHFPAVNVGSSVSRVMSEVVDGEHIGAMQKLRAMMAVYEEARDLITIGAYTEGNYPELDRAVAMQAELKSFLVQGEGDVMPWEDTVNTLMYLGRKAST